MTTELTFTPIRDSYTAIPTYPIAEAIFEGGATKKRADPLYLPHEVNVNWKLTSQQYTNFMGFFRTTLKEATEFFLMDLVTDVGTLLPHRCRTKGGMPRLQQINGSCFYVSAVLEVEVNPTYTGLILYEDPNIIRFTHTTPRLVGPLQPGDTIQVFNSEGTHPQGGVEWVFDGVNDQISMGDVLDMTRTTPRSVFVWYSTTVYGNAVVAKQAAASNTGWRFTVSSNADQDVIFSNSGGSQQIQVGANPRPPIDGAEHHFGWTFNGNSNASGFTFYLDGAATGKNTGTNNMTSAVITNSEPLQIGLRGSTAPFDGTIRHVSIWNRVLTAGEVLQVYGTGSPPDLSILSFFSDCIGWWKIGPLDTAASGGVVDYSSSGNDGTASGGLAPTVLPGEVDVNLDGTYEILSVTPNNQIELVSPELVNSDWSLLSSLGSFGTELSGNVISTVVRIPS